MGEVGLRLRHLIAVECAVVAGGARVVLLLGFVAGELRGEGVEFGSAVLGYGPFGGVHVRGVCQGDSGCGRTGEFARARGSGGGWSRELPTGASAGGRWRGRQARGSPLLEVGRRRGCGGWIVGGTQPLRAGLVGEGQDRQRPAGRCHQQVRGRSFGRVAILPIPAGGGDEVVAQGAQCGFGGVQNVVGDRVDLRRGLGCGEGVQVRGEIGRRPGLVGQGVRGAEGLCVASCPPLQVCAGGEVVTGGVNLVGVAADVVVQVEVWVARGDTEAFRACGGGP